MQTSVPPQAEKAGKQLGAAGALRCWKVLNDSTPVPYSLSQRSCQRRLK